jgi:hypothetical protein
MNDPVNWETVDALIQATAEARVVISESHEAQKDLRRLIQAAKEEIRGLAGPFLERIDSDVSEGLEAYKATLAKAIADATETVYNRFDVLAAICLGEDGNSIRKGQPTVEELIHRYVNLHPEIRVRLNSKKATG